MPAPLFMHVCRLAAALWFGGAALFTFVLTPIIFRTQNRDAAAGIVGTLFPAYFRWGLACGAVVLVALFCGRGKGALGTGIIVAVMLALTSFQAFYIEPRAAQLKREIPSFVTTPKDHPARRQFSRLHGISAVCNLAVIAGGAALVVML